MPLEGEDLPARVRIPDLYRPVLAAADDAFAVGTERHAVHNVKGPQPLHRVGMPLEGDDLCALVRIPDLHRPVLAAAGHALALPRPLSSARARTSRPLPTSQTFPSPIRTPGPPPATMRLPSGLKATL